MTQGAVLGAFPDDLLTRDDPTSTTGLRVAVPQAVIDAQPGLFARAWGSLAELDGFGTTAPMFLRFDGPVADPLPDGALRLVELPSGDALAFDVRHLDAGATLAVWPRVPLRPATRHALVATDALTDRTGGCVAPSEDLVQLLTATATAPELARLVPRYAELLAATGLGPDEIVAATVFTTQSVVEPARAVADDIAARDYAWDAPPTCTTQDDFVRCRGTFTAFDHRQPGYLGDPVTPTPYTLPVTVWLPRPEVGAGPFPLVVYGHGLGGDAAQAGFVAELIAPHGFAVAAIPAPRHKGHPTAAPSDRIVFELFGIDLDHATFDALTFRENLRQATSDKLQLLRLLASAPDVTSDGAPDLDLDRLAYWGVSLGTLMGPGFLAWADVDLAILAIGGGRLTDVIAHASSLSQYRDVFELMAGGPDGLVVGLAVAQALIDAADPATFAALLGSDAHGLAGAPHLLQTVVIDDDTVPNITSATLARALALPHLPPVIAAIDGLDAGPPLPTSANVDADRSAGLFQFDRGTTDSNPNPRKATHANVSFSRESQHQALTFLRTWRDAAAPTLVDPYVHFSTP